MAMMRITATCAATALFATPSAASAGSTQLEESADAGANPIRKVVNMLQNMQKQVTKEGEKEAKAYDAFMCYCKNGVTDLEHGIEAGKNKIVALAASLEAAKEKKAQTEVDLKDHQTSRSEAKEAMAKASAIREKEASAYAKVKTEYETNLSALGKAISAIDKGVFGSFLQTQAAKSLRNFFMEKADVNDASRQMILAFLSGAGGQTQGYVPQSGEVTGILKQMEDDMSRDLADATETENTAIQGYKELMAAKKKEVDALTAQIEQEMTRIGNLGVEISTMGIDLEDTNDTLGDDQTYLKEIGMSCETKTKEWEEIKATRSQELVALAETIKVLNNDDALELFKKTLPATGASSFAQVVAGNAAIRNKALSFIYQAQKRVRESTPDLDLVELALKGQKGGFDKVITMIDRMMSNLKQEQRDDNHKQEYCDAQIDQSDDKRKALELSRSDSQTAIEDLSGSISIMVDEIDTLEDGIRALDKSVAEATELRKAANEEYKEATASNANAKEVLLWAKNRLNKFYQPKLYKAPPKRDLSEAEDITVRMGGSLESAPLGGIAGTGIGAALMQIHAHNGHRRATPPETFGAYSKKTEESTGVIAMLDLIIRDVEKELTESRVEETDAQKDYEATMASAATKRAEDSKALTEKTAAKANAEEQLQAEKENLKATTKELMGTVSYLQSLHGECDWLLKYFDVRKAARTDEIESLQNAKAVLSGADYSFIQHGQRGLRR